MGDTRGLKLKDLVEEFEVTLQLNQHDKVGKICCQICTELVEVLDNEILENDEASDLGEEDSSIELLHRNTVNNICQILREYSQIADAYRDVIEYVSVRDMVCLSRLVGALDIEETTEEAKFIDIDESASLMRKSIRLLRSINQRDKSEGANNLRIPKDAIKRSTGNGFPILEVDLRRTYVDKLSLDDYPERAGRGVLSAILQSDWFKQFERKLDNSRYPLDRFTILVAIWIIGNQCKHATLERIIGELVEQVYHEETNSCNEDELLQLTQVGSFWLSYHKRYGIAMKQANLQSSDDEELLDSASVSLASVQSSSDSLDNGCKDASQESNLNPPIDLRQRLRKLIDEEFLHGTPCVLCNYQPQELLEPLHSEFCRGCGNGPIERCSLSYQPFAMINLAALKSARPQLSTLVVITANEWIRHMLAPNLELRRLGFIGADSKRVVEKEDISATFERLTMIRSESREDSEDKSSDDEPSETNPRLDSMKDSTSLDYRNIMKTFMNIRQDKREPHISESMSMIRFIDNGCTFLPACSSDMLIKDSGGDSICILIASSCSLPSIWTCSVRSDVSNLIIGCDRMFSSLELARLGQGALDQYTCPFCQVHLTEVQSINFEDSFKA